MKRTLLAKLLLVVCACTILTQAEHFSFTREGDTSPNIILEGNFSITIKAFYNQKEIASFTKHSSETEDVRVHGGIGSRSFLYLRFSHGISWAFVFNMATANVISLDRLIQFVPHTVFPNISDITDSFEYDDPGIMDIGSPNNSYACEQESVVEYYPLSIDPTTVNYTVHVTLRNFRAQAFNVENGAFSPAVHCETDYTTTAIPTSPKSTVNSTTATSASTTKLITTKPPPFPPATTAKTTTLKTTETTTPPSPPATSASPTKLITTKPPPFPPATTAKTTTLKTTETTTPPSPPATSASPTKLITTKPPPFPPATTATTKQPKTTVPHHHTTQKPTTQKSTTHRPRPTRSTRRPFPATTATTKQPKTTVPHHHTTQKPTTQKSTTHRQRPTRSTRRPFPATTTTPRDPTLDHTTPKPDIQTYVVKDNKTGHVCISVRGKMEFDINYNASNPERPSVTTLTSHIGIPKDYTIKGECASGSTHQSLTIFFFTDWYIKLTFELHRSALLKEYLEDSGNSELDYSISDITLSYTIDHVRFPYAVEKDGTRHAVHMSDNNIADRLRKKKGQGYYQCNSKLNIPMGEHVNLDTSNLKFKAFNDNDDDDFKGKPAICFADESSDFDWRIVGYILLAFLLTVLFIIVIYIIFRWRRNERRGYARI